MEDEQDYIPAEALEVEEGAERAEDTEGLEGLRTAEINSDEEYEAFMAEKRANQARRSVTPMITTEEDLRMGVPFAKMRRIIIVVFMLLLVAAIIYWLYLR